MARKYHRYYTLISAGSGEPWVIEFGDYSKAVVKQEWRDMKESAPRGTWFRIVESGDSQAEIEAAVAKQERRRRGSRGASD